VLAVEEAAVIGVGVDFAARVLTEFGGGLIEFRFGNIAGGDKNTILVAGEETCIHVAACAAADESHLDAVVCAENGARDHGGTGGGLQKLAPVFHDLLLSLPATGDKTKTVSLQQLQGFIGDRRAYTFRVRSTLA